MRALFAILTILAHLFAPVPPQAASMHEIARGIAREHQDGGTWKVTCQEYAGPQWGGRKARKANVSCAAINQGGGMWKAGVMFDLAVLNQAGGWHVLTRTFAGGGE